MAYKNPKEIDWTPIEVDYRLGAMSNRELGEKHGCTEGAIRDRAKRYGWVKGSPDEVREVAQRKADDAGLPIVPPDPAERIAQIGALAGDVIISHRRQIANMRAIASSMLDELGNACENREEIEESLIEYFAAKMEDANPRAIAALQNRMNTALSAVSLGSRTKSMLNLVNSIAKCIELERKSFRLDEETGDKTYEELLREIHEKAMEPVAS